MSVKKYLNVVFFFLQKLVFIPFEWTFTFFLIILAVFRVFILKIDQLFGNIYFIFWLVFIGIWREL